MQTRSPHFGNGFSVSVNVVFHFGRVALSSLLGEFFMLSTESIFKLLGYIMIVAAVVIAALGKAKISIMILWVKTWPLLWVRAWLLFGLLFAGLLIVGTR